MNRKQFFTSILAAFCAPAAFLKKSKKTRFENVYWAGTMIPRAQPCPFPLIHPFDVALRIHKYHETYYGDPESGIVVLSGRHFLQSTMVAPSKEATEFIS